LVVETIGGLGELVAGRGGGGTVNRSGRGGRVTAGELATGPTSESGELVALRALGNLDAVLIEPLLEPGVVPGVDQLVGQGLLSIDGRGRQRRGRVVGVVGSAVGGDVRITADGCDELVARVGLGCGNTTLVEPLLEVGFGPGLVEPVARVGGSLTSLVGSLLVVGADSGQE